MLEKLLLPENHAIAILIRDHDKVKDLFDRFKKAGAPAEKEKIIAEAVSELKVHAVIEEEIFYPAVRRQLSEDVMNEADEEHHVARVLIAELDRDGRGDDHREAKFTVLAESVRHHIREEEGEMLPKAKSLDLDFEDLGKEMLARKKELQHHGIPPDAEHAMVAGVHGKSDSPAVPAKSQTPPRLAKTSAGRSKERKARGTAIRKANQKRPTASR
jgi:hypothetical protein